MRRPDRWAAEPSDLDSYRPPYAAKHRGTPKPGRLNWRAALVLLRERAWRR